MLSVDRLGRRGKTVFISQRACNLKEEAGQTVLTEEGQVCMVIADVS